MKRRILCALGALLVGVAAHAAALVLPEAVMEEAEPLLPVLRMEERLYSVNDGALVRLDEVTSEYTGQPMAWDRLALADVDQDGRLEAVLSFPISEADTGYLVLDSKDGLVTGYELPARALMDLKADGSFGYASGAMDNGIGWLQFDGPEHRIIPESWMQTGPDGGPQYFVHGQPADEAAFHKALAFQQGMPDALWQAQPAQP